MPGHVTMTDQACSLPETLIRPGRPPCAAAAAAAESALLRPPAAPDFDQHQAARPAAWRATLVSLPPRLSSLLPLAAAQALATSRVTLLRPLQVMP